MEPTDPKFLALAIEVQARIPPGPVRGRLRPLLVPLAEFVLLGYEPKVIYQEYVLKTGIKISYTGFYAWMRNNALVKGEKGSRAGEIVQAAIRAGHLQPSAHTVKVLRAQNRSVAADTQPDELVVAKRSIPEEATKCAADPGIVGQNQPAKATTAEADPAEKVMRAQNFVPSANPSAIDAGAVHDAEQSKEQKRKARHELLAKMLEAMESDTTKSLRRLK